MQQLTKPDNLPLCLWARPSAPACVYFLADHLDAVLAAGEDMRVIRFSWVTTGAKPQDVLQELENLRENVATLRSLELTLIARLLKSRERAEDLARADARLKLMARLFLNGTAPIVEAVTELTDITASDFDNGDAALAYLRARELLAADAAAPADGAVLRITEAFPIARRLPLGTLMDLVAQFLDTIELHHDIYTDQWARLGPGQTGQTEEPTAMSATDNDKKKAAPPSTEADAARAAAPPRKGYRSLTAALAELEEQERAKQTESAAS